MHHGDAAFVSDCAKQVRYGAQHVAAHGRRLSTDPFNPISAKNSRPDRENGRHRADGPVEGGTHQGGRVPGKRHGDPQEGDPKGTGKKGEASSHSWYMPPAAPTPPFVSAVAATAPETTYVQQPASKDTEELQKLRGLMKAIKSSGQALPEEITKAVESVETVCGKEETKTYRTLVTNLGTARKELSEVTTAWRNYKAAWVKHCAEMMTLFESQLTSYEEGEANFQKQRQVALDKVEEVKSRVKEMHDKVTSTHEDAAMLEAEEAEDPDIAEPTIQVKKLKSAMKEAISTVQATMEENSPRRKQQKHEGAEQGPQ